MFWLEDDRPVPVAININNLASVLRNEQHKEVINIWMRKDVPSITVQAPVDHKSGGQLKHGHVEGSASSSPPVTKPFLAWPVVDEFGEWDPLDLDDRCQRFLRAIVLDLPVPIIMSKEERARRPKQASAQRVAAKARISIPDKTFAEVRNEIEADGNDALAVEIRDKFKDLLGFFLPDSYGINSGSEPMRLYWGAVYVITVWLLLEFFKERANDACHAGCCEEWFEESGFARLLVRIDCYNSKRKAPSSRCLLLGSQASSGSWGVA